MLGEVERSAESSQEDLEESARPRRSLSTVPESEEKDDSEEEQQLEGENSFCAVPVDHPVEIPHDRKLLSHKFLLSIIFSRCRDSAASVRSKALTLLAECTLSTNRTIMLAMQHIFVNNKPRMFSTPHITQNGINLESPSQEEGNDEEELEFPNASIVVAMLHRRALDGKVTVRKSALQVLGNLMKLHNDMLSRQNLAVLAEHCRDPALLIRKQMVVSLTSLLEHYPEHKGITTTWIKAVLPLILDPEVKVQERVVEALDQLLFQRVLPAGHAKEHTPESLLPWSILATLTKCSYHKFFNKVLLHWSKMDNRKPQVVHLVKSHIGREHNEEAWTLLAMLSGYITIKDLTFAVDYFDQHCHNKEEVGSYTLLQVLKVLSNSMKHVPGDRAEALHHQLLLPLSSFSVGAELISSMMDTVTLLTYTLHGDDVEGQKAIENWVAPILKMCDDHLKQVLFLRADPLDSAGEEKLYRHLFTMGEAAMLCPQKVNKRMFLMLQSLIFHQQGQEVENAPPTMPSSQTQCSQPTTITFTPTVRLKALSVVTLGKMCLQHEEQAKRIIPALGCMLTASTHPAIKNNILFTLTDMCVRYATIVDPLMDQVTACLRDPHPQVHRTALTLLISLLQEDYLKLKGSFFYRILQCLTEKDEEMREMVVFYITERLLKRFPKILCQHFIECIFHYNCYEEHESYNRFCQSSLEKEVFSLAGSEHSHERHAIYHFMLEHMPDDQRFLTTQRLCQDVLGAVMDGRIKLNKNSMPMLEDTLTILRSDEIKLASLKSRPEDNDQPTDQAEQAAMAGMVIKKTIISQVVKQNVIENIVPILIAVKHKLEEQRSPLMKHLLLYLKELMKDYKNEVKEILAGDKQLAKEIEFDLRRFDREQWEENNQPEDTNQRVLKARETNNKVNNRETLGASPAHLERRLPVEQDAQRTPAGASAPPANIKEVYTRAQVFSKTTTARRKSVAVTSSTNDTREPSRHLQAIVRLRRISIADLRTTHCDTLNPTRDETVRDDLRAIGGYPQQEEEEEEGEVKEKENMEEKEEENVESEKNESRQESGKNKTRLQLLRAISTPSTDRTIISNLTFINETQEVSAIDMNSTISSGKSGSGGLHLHPTSPTSHQQESDFTRLRRTSKDLPKDPFKSGRDKAKHKKKKVSGGLFESYENSQSEEETTCESDVSTVSGKSVGKRVEGKRTRHVASLSPDPEKTTSDKHTEKPKPDANTEKPKLKKHKRGIEH